MLNRKLLTVTIIIAQMGAFAHAQAENKVCVSIADHAQQATTHADGVTVTAKLMLPAEYKKRFYPLQGPWKSYENTDLNAESIYPITVSITNNKKKAITLAIPQVNIEDARTLTPAEMNSMITANKALTVGSLFLFFPFAFFFRNQSMKIEQFLPLIKEHGFGDEKVVVQPQETYQAVLFVRLHITTRDNDKKLVSPVLPARFDVLVPVSA